MVQKAEANEWDGCFAAGYPKTEVEEAFKLAPMLQPGPRYIVVTVCRTSDLHGGRQVIRNRSYPCSLQVARAVAKRLRRRYASAHNMTVDIEEA